MEYVGGLVVGIIMLMAATYAIIKIKRGSKSRFALEIMYFTVGLGISYILYFFFVCFGREVTNSNGVTKPRQFMYLVFTNAYFYYLLALQQWRFAMHYLASAMGLFEKPCLK